jgi:SAM-dependent methyltransferase
MRDHRFFAAIYDWMLKSSEEAGLERMRAEVLAGAEGRTLELGAGTGLNLKHYTDRVDELVLTEPDRFMARRLRDRVAEQRLPVANVDVIEAAAERLPLEDGSVDTVVSTLVMCTVEDPEAAGAEILRVLRPGGRLLYLEHVLSDSPRLARWQHRLETPWKWFGAGCHCNRDTAATLAGAGLDLDAPSQGEFPKAPPFVRPLISGIATRPAG